MKRTLIVLGTLILIVALSLTMVACNKVTQESFYDQFYTAASELELEENWSFTTAETNWVYDAEGVEVLSGEEKSVKIFFGSGVDETFKDATVSKNYETEVDNKGAYTQNEMSTVFYKYNGQYYKLGDERRKAFNKAGVEITERASSAKTYSVYDGATMPGAMSANPEAYEYFNDILGNKDVSGIARELYLLERGYTSSDSYWGKTFEQVDNTYTLKFSASDSERDANGNELSRTTYEFKYVMIKEKNVLKIAQVKIAALYEQVDEENALKKVSKTTYLYEVKYNLTEGFTLPTNPDSYRPSSRIG